MTDQLIDQRGFDKSPRELWAEWQQTKFPDDQILEIIYYAQDCPIEYSATNAQTAQAMIAYNNMIDARIERARRTWGMK